MSRLPSLRLKSMSPVRVDFPLIHPTSLPPATASKQLPRRGQPPLFVSYWRIVAVNPVCCLSPPSISMKEPAWFCDEDSIGLDDCGLKARLSMASRPHGDSPRSSPAQPFSRWPVLDSTSRSNDAMPPKISLSGGHPFYSSLFFLRLDTAEAIETCTRGVSRNVVGVRGRSSGGSSPQTPTASPSPPLFCPTAQALSLLTRRILDRDLLTLSHDLNLFLTPGPSAHPQVKPSSVKAERNQAIVHFPPPPIISETFVVPSPSTYDHFPH